MWALDLDQFRSTSITSAGFVVLANRKSYRGKENIVERGGNGEGMGRGWGGDEERIG